MRFAIFALIALFSTFATAVHAEQRYDCEKTAGFTNTLSLDRAAGTAMHGHVIYVTCIAAALNVKNYANASHIAATKLGLNTKGGQRSGILGYREPSQELWEKGHAFRRQATRFAASANAAARVPNDANRLRTYGEFLHLLSLCQGCHATY